MPTNKMLGGYHIPHTPIDDAPGFIVSRGKAIVLSQRSLGAQSMMFSISAKNS